MTRLENVSRPPNAPSTGVFLASNGLDVMVEVAASQVTPTIRVNANSAPAVKRSCDPSLRPATSLEGRNRGPTEKFSTVPSASNCFDKRARGQIVAEPSDA